MSNTTCRHCGQPIIWAKTEKGRRIPVDPTPKFGGNLQLGPAKSPPLAKTVPPLPYVRRHMPHYATCPHRTKRQRKNTRTAQLQIPDSQ